MSAVARVRPAGAPRQSVSAAAGPQSVPAAAPGGCPCILVLDDPRSLEGHLAAWDDLAAHAVEPNVFHEPWMLLPAWRLLGEGEGVLFVLVYLAGPLLCAVVPLQRRRFCRGLPVTTLRLWTHPYCFLGTPLLRRGYEDEALGALLDWFSANRLGASILELQGVAAGGVFQEHLDAALAGRAALRHASETSPRALFVPASDADRYLRDGLPRRRRKEIKRLERRLGDRGGLCVRECGPGDDVGEWIDAFLRLEASGWKGERGSALASSERSEQYFAAVTREAFHRGRLMMFGLFLGRRPVAMKCSLLSAPGSFAFKIAYDESYGRFSPGLQLEVENIRRLHRRPDIHFMDSCADHDNFMINHLWRHRRSILTTFVASRALQGRLFLRLMPLRRLGRRVVRGPALAAGEGTPEGVTA